MAAPINTPSTADIWHLSIDDLLAPLPDTVRLGGPGPFVINLSASTAPIDPPARSNIAAREDAYVYQVQRIEDRRPRYRLRLGPFASEDEADAVLKRVRDVYPSALTATADADDLRAIASLRTKADPPEAVPVAVKPVNSAAPGAVSPPVLTAGQKIPARGPTPIRAPTAIRAPGAMSGMAIAPPPARVPVPAPATAPMPSPVRAPMSSPVRGPASAPVTEAPPAEYATSLPTLESTQTVRALTPLELEDAQASRWFVIQLSLAENAFDPETVPNLDIFRVYRLYSVAGIDQGRIVHALRLGFFGEENAAAAVASYLSGFYENPTVKRVSAAERQRFAEQPLEPRKDVGETGKQAVIEITSERYVRERRTTQRSGK